VPQLPDGITLKRNRDLAGRARHLQYRRGLLALIGVLPVLALLNFFGQKPVTTEANAAAASLSVTAPERLRGGLIFQVRTTVVAHRPIKHPAIVFDQGWWDSMSENSIAPNPISESSRDGRVVLSYGRLEAGQTLVSSIYFQANPTNVGTRRENVELDDGTRPIATVHRSLTVWP
jgi:hypothetical protein